MPKYYTEHRAGCLIIRWRKEGCPIHYLRKKKHFIDIMKGEPYIIRAYLMSMLTSDEIESMMKAGYGCWIFKKYAA